MTDGLPNPRRALAFLTLAIAMTMAVLDGAIVNVALPTISIDMAVTPAHAIWVVNAYQLAITVSLLPLATLGDILGYRKVYGAGLVIFTIASVACGVSTSLNALTVARLAQGLGAASMMSVNMAFVRFIYPKDQLGRGVGNMAVVVASAAAAGPSAAAAILSVAPWRWLFFVNAPLGLIAIALAARTLPKTPRLDHRLDMPSVVLNAATFGLLIMGVDALGERDLSPAVIELACAVAAGVLLVWRQIGLPAPVLPIDLLRLPVFALSMASSISSFGAQALAMVALPFLFQGAMHQSPATTGLLLTPWPVGTALIAPIAGRLADRYPPGKLGSIGLVVFGAGLVTVALMPTSPSWLDVAWRLLICGVGFGFFQSPNNRAIIGSAPPGRSGGAAGLQSTGRLVGQSLGTATMAVLFGRLSMQPTTAAIWIAAGLCGIGAVASGFRKVA